MSSKQQKIRPDGAGVVDSHAHLDRGVWGDELEPMLQRAWDGGLGGILAIASAGEATIFSEIMELTAKDPRLAMAAAVHPHDSDRWDDLATALRAAAKTGNLAALGEIGLDYFYDLSSRNNQERAFREQLLLAREYDLPVILHIRDAYEQGIEILDSIAPEWAGVLHCFTGGPGEAQMYLDRGFYISFPGVITFRNCGDLPAALAKVPLDRLLVETDSPYLAPNPVRGRRNEPANVVYTLQYMASMLDIEYTRLAQTVSLNAAGLFRINSWVRGMNIST